MPSELVCFEQNCRARFTITEVLYNCPRCGGLLEVDLGSAGIDAAALKSTWRERRMCNTIADQSGVWRYREMLPFDGYVHLAVSLREGNTPLLDAPLAARYGGAPPAGGQDPGHQPTRPLPEPRPTPRGGRRGLAGT